jgi:lactate permease
VLSSTVGRQTPVLALFVPLVLVVIVDGRRGVREARVPALGCGVVFALGQFVTSNFISVELTDIVASLLGAVAVFAPARVQPHATWAAREPAVAAGGGPARRPSPTRAPRSARPMPPYVIIVVVLALAQLPGIKQLLASVRIAFAWPELDVLNPAGARDKVDDFSFSVLSTAGTLMVVAGPTARRRREADARAALTLRAHARDPRRA